MMRQQVGVQDQLSIRAITAITARSQKHSRSIQTRLTGTTSLTSCFTTTGASTTQRWPLPWEWTCQNFSGRMFGGRHSTTS